MSIQLSGSLLEMCVLAIVRKEDTYGYRLTQEIKQEFDLSESSLYPVLRRLTRSGCLKTYDRPYDGRMRRYYSLTEQGEEHSQHRTAPLALTLVLSYNLKVSLIQ